MFCSKKENKVLMGCRRFEKNRKVEQRYRAVVTGLVRSEFASMVRERIDCLGVGSLKKKNQTVVADGVSLWQRAVFCSKKIKTKGRRDVGASEKNM